MSVVKNKVQLIGNLGQAPEIKSLNTGKKVAHIRVATNESYRNAAGEKVTDTQWHNVTAWGKLADLAEKYLVKGMEVVVEGKLVYHEYVDKQGVKRFSTEIIASDLLMLTKKGQ